MWGSSSAKPADKWSENESFNLDSGSSGSQPSSSFAQPAPSASFAQQPAFSQSRGIPAHLDDSQPIRLRDHNKKKQLEKVNRENLSMFQEKLSATIGPSYVASFFLGGMIGLTKVPPARHLRTTRLRLNAYVNNVGKTSARFGNNVGGAILMYITMGKFLNFLFQEEFEDLLTIPMQNAVFGGVTGALYKSTRGRRAMVLGSLIGASIGSLYAYAWQKTNMFRFSN